MRKGPLYLKVSPVPNEDRKTGCCFYVELRRRLGDNTGIVVLAETATRPEAHLQAIKVARELGMKEIKQ